MTSFGAPVRGQTAHVTFLRHFGEKRESKPQGRLSSLRAGIGGWLAIGRNTTYTPLELGSVKTHPFRKATLHPNKMLTQLKQSASIKKMTIVHACVSAAAPSTPERVVRVRQFLRGAATVAPNSAEALLCFEQRKAEEGGGRGGRAHADALGLVLGHYAVNTLVPEAACTPLCGDLVGGDDPRRGFQS